MKQHEREFFIYRIRSGVVKVGDFCIKAPTIEDKLEASEVFVSAYNEAQRDGMMTEEELEGWMVSVGVWTPDDEQKLRTAEKDIEKLKIEIFNNHANDSMVANIRKYLRAAEKFRNKKIEEKQAYAGNTVEGIARTEETLSLIKATTYKDGKKVDFEDDVELLNELMYHYVDDMLPESYIRELARNAPWSSWWSIKDNVNDYKLFNNPEHRELTNNQHSLIIWSQTYDNIQESMDCPVDYVINDDDMLDGWFLTQANKRDKQRSEKDFDENTKSSKIKSAGEVFVMSKGKKDNERINRMNSAHGNAVKNQRFNLLKKKGSAKQSDFADEKLKLQTMANNQFKDSVRRR